MCFWLWFLIIYQQNKQEQVNTSKQHIQELQRLGVLCKHDN